MKPHASLTPGQIASCRSFDLPPPPTDAVRSDGVYAWREPESGAVLCAETPNSYRWGFQGDVLIRFRGYGWRSRRVGYGRSEGDPEFGYDLLDQNDRDAAARRDMMEVA